MSAKMLEHPGVSGKYTAIYATVRTLEIALFGFLGRRSACGLRHRRAPLSLRAKLACAWHQLEQEIGICLAPTGGGNWRMPETNWRTPARLERDLARCLFCSLLPLGWSMHELIVQRRL
jgi:hypothetical protein